MLSFSTCWNSARHTDGEEVIDEILELGFDTVELSHGIPISLLPGFLRAIQSQKIKVSGVHNYFPAPMDVYGDSPDCYQMTSYRKEERDWSLRLSKQSIQKAAQFGGKYLVLHMGSVLMIPKNKGYRRLRHIIESGKMNSDEYWDAKDELVRLRRKYSDLYCERAKVALEEMLPVAQAYGIQLAIEGRSHYEQIPNVDELRYLLDFFKDCDNIGYWHDFGHIQRQENLCFLDHHEFLEEFGSRCIGGHVNDVKGYARDHQVPFQGQVDFEGLLKYLRPGIPMVWELASRRTKEDIIEARQVWQQKFPLFS